MLSDWTGANGNAMLAAQTTTGGPNMTIVQTGAKYLSLILLAGVMVACATDPQKVAANQTPMHDDPSKGIICTKEKPIGSIVEVKRCTTPEQRADQARQAEAQMVIEPGRGNAR